MTTNPLREAITLAGEQAFRNGLLIYHCPYLVGTHKYGWWVRGHHLGFAKAFASAIDDVVKEGNSAGLEEAMNADLDQQAREVVEGHPVWKK